MSTFPTGKRSDFLLWSQAHAPVWEANAADIGLTLGQAEAFGIAIVKLADAELVLEEARQAYLAAARAAQASYQLAKREASDAVHLIRAFAGSQKNPLAIYNAAQIAPPAAKSKAPPPAQPTRLAAALGANDGSLTLSWKCSNPEGTSGTSYIVRRRLSTTADLRPGESGFTILAIVGKKTFVDTSLPAGIESVEYTVQGQRADVKGAVSAILSVNFGKNSQRMRSKASVTASASTIAHGIEPLAARPRRERMSSIPHP